MTKTIPIICLLFSTSAIADWVKIQRGPASSVEKLIDEGAIRQTGPMNTMRRVWEITNYAQPDTDKMLSTKNYIEYDCMNNRVRVLEETRFAERGAQGPKLPPAPNVVLDNWMPIERGSISRAVLMEVCPGTDDDSNS